MEPFSRWIMLAGIVLLILGTVLHFFPSILNWFGKLPGDIRIETQHGKIFIPVTSMLAVSIALSLIINLFRK